MKARSNLGNAIIETILEKMRILSLIKPYKNIENVLN